MENTVPISDEFISLCREIVKENKNLEEWAEIESGDMFQSASFCGGFDADEKEFTFSYYDTKRNEWWFQLPIEKIAKILAGEVVKITAKEPK